MRGSPASYEIGVRMLKNRGCSIALVLVVVLAILLVATLDLYTDIAWLETLGLALSLIHISEPTRLLRRSRMPSTA